MSESFLKNRVTLHAGDCMDVLRTLPDNSVDSVCTDPPYHLTSIVKRFSGEAKSQLEHSATKDLGTINAGAFKRLSRGFMGQKWDGGDIAFQPALWAEVLRVLKPGGHMVAFSGTRTYHRMACAIEDAGFEIRDQLAWCFGSGFPKSHDVSKGIDKAAGVVREQSGREPRLVNARAMSPDGAGKRQVDPGARFDIPVTDAAKQWDGWGTALKPAWEPIVLARKPLSEGTVVANVLKHGTGGLNVGACRIGTEGGIRKANPVPDSKTVSAYGNGLNGGGCEPIDAGRWPANLCHDGSPEVLARFPESKSSPYVENKPAASLHEGGIHKRTAGGFTDSGSAARFFFSAKADSDDRLGSGHPTVKPVDLMRWLVRLVTPKGGTVLDLFAGTGTTGEAAWLEGMNAILIEREVEYQADIRRRMALCLAGPDERARESIKAKMKDKPAEHGPLFNWEG